MTESTIACFRSFAYQGNFCLRSYRINLRIVNKICAVDTAVKAGLIVYGKDR